MPAAADDAPGRRLRVLAADDQPVNRQVLKLMLEPLGLSLTFAANGEEAVAAATDEAFDLILMDAQMPVMDGAEAVRRIRGLEGRAGAVPIHMLTANAFDEDAARYAEAGADGVVTKPIDRAALCALVAAVGEAARIGPVA